jgi:hypothetical protein
MSDTGIPSSTTSGSARTIFEIGRPFPDVLEIGGRVTFQQGPLMDV